MSAQGIMNVIQSYSVKNQTNPNNKNKFLANQYEMKANEGFGNQKAQISQQLHHSNQSSVDNFSESNYSQLQKKKALAKKKTYHLSFLKMPSRMTLKGQSEYDTIINSENCQDEVQNLSQFNGDYKQIMRQFTDLEKNYKDLCNDVVQTYEFVNQIVHDGDIQEVQDFQKNNFDLSYKEKSPQTLLKLVQAMFRAFLKNKTETSQLLDDALIKVDNDKNIQDYIHLLQKAEAENRQNIREKQQLKLSLESYQEKLKNSEQQNKLLAQYSQNEMEQLIKEYYKKHDDLKISNDEIQELQNMIKKLNSANESLEERCISIIILENKCRKLGIKFDDDMNRVKDQYGSKEKDIIRSYRETMKKDRNQELYLLKNIKEDYGNPQHLNENKQNQKK
ncbi:hypothetical protein PPERSA_02120 [Pseudocohnilembus persalinus]|uniref:Uncharacterized protein n=1 Tax=Pseudocohnilembus persalinus TaxID=266149 RepID=A0A0V0Q8H0_PSEPJ|nr:hypothetical protein PPERSA_02120 [Pseudocohnilembus persalinus]|eukprot:KRW98343.1 hypothetical protein PPERSA_02120 [Pseudocohnilembus persalinus]